MKTWLKLALLMAAIAAIALIAFGCSRIDDENEPGTPTGPPAITAPTPNPAFHETALVIDGVEISVIEYNYFYARLFGAYMESTQGLGADLTVPLDQQPSMFDEEQTIDEMLHEQTVSQIRTMIALSNAADRAGISLDPSDHDEIRQYQTAVEEQAAEMNVTPDELIAYHFGYGADMALLLHDMERSILVNRYVDQFRDNLTFTDAELETAYNEDPNAVDFVDFRVFSFDGTPTGNDTEEDAMAQARERAEAMMAAVDTEADFIAYANENRPPEQTGFDGDQHTLEVGSSYTRTPVLVREYLFDTDRQGSDITVIAGQSEYFVVMFLRRYRPEGPASVDDVESIDVRHILIGFEERDGVPGHMRDDITDEERDDIRHAAQDILDQWLAGAATEASFADLARQYSDCPSGQQGGMLANTQRGQMVPEFNDWCFDSTRQVGDYGVVMTQFGAHVMYMSSIGTQWQDLIRPILERTAVDEHIETLTEAAEVVENDDFDRTFMLTFLEEPEEAAPPTNDEEENEDTAEGDENTEEGE
ncbi:MAG: peptidyl-prolyl cis-trans isomerase [Oscillospiraceae bacterium]|nr:peptidyl-prolyl cis-trans isomerase [Oscillospiraceae bacterium]